MVKHLRRLLAYDAWANRDAFEALVKAPGAPARARAIMAHIVAAEDLWLSRLNQDRRGVIVWPEFDEVVVQAGLAALPDMWTRYLDGRQENDLLIPVQYTNSAGENWSNTPRDVLEHVVTHSAYHRGQIATLLGTVGAKPAYTDFIHAVRQGFVA